MWSCNNIKLFRRSVLPLLFGLFNVVNCFVFILPQRTIWSSKTIIATTSVLLLSKSSNNDHDEEEDRMQQLRSLLETSWNQSLMGNIPTTPMAAAQEIADCFFTHENAGVSIIDLQLPSLDLRQGARWYDAVLAADVAHLLVERLVQRQRDNNVDANDTNKQTPSSSKKALLLVRDEATVRSIERVWEKRALSFTEDDTEEEENDEEEDEQEMSNNNEETTVLYDDFADFGFLESIAAVESLSTSSPNASDSQQKPRKRNTETIDRRRIQLQSLFGEAIISEGADMEQKVIRALQSNVVSYLKEQQDEIDTIAMIAPVTRPEVMAICALVQKYAKTMRIILINPHFAKPRPMELQHAKTVYSLRPFLVRAKDSRKTLTKIVVLKRKQEWEVFISDSASEQFERLAVNRPKGIDAIDGPSMEWVAACAQQYLQQKNAESQ
ncbi:hypothetical protein FisN_28Hh087 [Fistulifera solaris]|uniref:DUF1995 domain-containing protein n=1 Tax=Fistulifera solaris TaxID=1519565 RepID=A0A1Z5KHQ0_FISSO|nr:hypothetical protein FisN_28Hh087 [Fistulifera solaris]|eukprot:GAX25612.1 hypothetical protein FisN_28Hh087 [Fistulifera solaris]